MKKNVYYALLLVALGGALAFLPRLWAQENVSFQTYEYGTIRWNGREHTHFIRPNGKVEMLGPILKKLERPDRVEERAFYMNLAVNAVAKEGYEVVSMTSDEIIMKRPLPR